MYLFIFLRFCSIFWGWRGTSDVVLVGSFCMTPLSNAFKLFFSLLTAYFSHGFSAPYQTLSTASQALLQILPSFLTQLSVCFWFSVECCPFILSAFVVVVSPIELLGLCFAFSFHRSRYVTQFLNSWHSFHLPGENVYSGHPHFCPPFFWHHL